MAWIIELILGAGAVGVSLYFLVKYLKKFVKDTKLTKVDEKVIKKLALYISFVALGGAILQRAFVNYHSYDLSYVEDIMNEGGAFFFVYSFTACLSLFYIHYYKENVEDKKTIFYWMIGFIVLCLISLLVMLEGVANEFTYPLVSGINIFGNGHFISFFNSENKYLISGGLSIAFYGAIMVFSVIVVYWICDHEFFKEFGKHGILDNVALAVFPAGVIGARIGYVIGNWNGDVTNPISDGWDYWIKQGNWYRIDQGGLTILGGALGGIIVGVIFVLLRRKYVNVRWAMDVIVPCILLAQAIGRWGNFFNHEVYGAEVSVSEWKLLPSFIKNQMATSFTNGAPSGDTIYVPLFLIESLINLAGFFIIKYAVGRLVPKILPLGSLCGAYLMWYGITRVIMEPLRDPTFNMGTKGNWSLIWAIIYIVGGLLLIGIFYLVDILKKRNAKNG